MSERLILDELTGLVHVYAGVSLTGPLLCECPLIGESAEANKLTVIGERHLEHGIWEAAPCLDGGDRE